MSNSSQRTDLVILAVLGGMSLLVVLALVVWGPLRGKRERETVARTTHSTNAEGAKVYYVLLERLGFDVRRSRYAFETGNLEDLRVLLVLDPWMPLRDDELLALSAWMSGGGVLVFTTSCDGAMRFWYYADDAARVSAAAHALPTRDSADTTLPSATTLDAGDTPSQDALGEDVPEWVAPPGQQAVTGLWDEVIGETEFDSTASVYLRRKQTESRRPPEVLYADRNGARVAARPFGQGWLIAVADSSFLANGQIGRGGNSVLATHLAAYARWRAGGGPIGFDEYHLGFGARESAWQIMGYLLLRTSPGWGVLAVMAAGLLWLLYKGRKFGTRRGIVRSRRRSKLEYVHSVGETYRIAKAERIVLEQILQWFRRRSAELVGTTPSGSDRELAWRLSRRSGRSPEEYEDVLRQCQEATRRPDLSARQLSKLLERLAAVETETFDAHSRSQ